MIKTALKNFEKDDDLVKGIDKPITSSSSIIDTISNDIVSNPNGFELSKNGHFENHVGKYLDGIISICEAIQKKPDQKKFNPFQYAQLQTNQKKHPGAILDVLKTIFDYWETIDSPWRYANTCMKSINQNYNEADHKTKADKFKKIFDLDPRIKKLTEGIGNRTK